jgi:hypothetical protein
MVYLHVFHTSTWRGAWLQGQHIPSVGFQVLTAAMMIALMMEAKNTSETSENFC